MYDTLCAAYLAEENGQMTGRECFDCRDGARTMAIHFSCGHATNARENSSAR